MKIKICIILFFLVILSCQKKGEIPNNNEPEKAAELKEQKQNTAPQMTIKDIEGYHTDEIINAVSGKQDEYTGKYVFSRMESKETMETFLSDNNLQLGQKTAEDFKNSYITIKLGGNGKYIIEPSEKLIRSLIFMESGEIFAYNTSSSTGVHFYYSASDSLKQSDEILYFFNNNKELVVSIEIRNAAKYSGEYEVLIEDEKINVYNFFYKRQIEIIQNLENMIQ
jgi:hypothetical protein